uniref:(northern house mosquito) hypothetical protein n=1 Tax=Culex pipiens TaxID=7175 RepID=A0A8D8FRC0_CULPI
MIIACVLMGLFPDLFQNDLILLPVCGFERQTLNHVSRLEKFVILPLIVVTFVMSSAYESKIIANMTSFPHVPNPRTLEDLLQAGIAVETGPSGSTWVMNDPRLSQVLKQDPSSSNTNNLLGYCGTSREIQFLVEHPRSYDTDLKLSRYVILD